jgi:uncharacterized phage protein (TIGR01671 family)
MREIKFRAWVGEAMSFPLTIGDIIGGHLDWDDEKPPTLMQFTGLHDKNGKEIYEGDVLRVMRAKYGPGRRGPGTLRGYDEMMLECFFDAGRAGFMFRNNKMDWSAAFGLEDSYEIIGNIYENPELINA